MPTGGNEKLGIQLEVEPIQATENTFAELRKALESILGTHQGIAQAEEASTAAAKEHLKVTKETREVVKETKNAFNAALTIDIDKAGIEAAKKALQAAINGLKTAAKSQGTLDLTVEIAGKKGELEKQLAQEKALIEKFKHEADALFASIGETESKALTVLKKVNEAKGAVDPDLALRHAQIMAVKPKSDEIYTQMEAAERRLAVTSEALHKVKAGELQQEISFKEKLLTLTNLLKNANSLESVSHIQEEIRALGTMAEQYKHVRDAIRGMNVETERIVTTGVVKDAVASAKPVKSTTAPHNNLNIISPEQITRLASLAEQFSTTITPFLEKLNRVEDLIVKGSSLKIDGMLTEISKMSRVLDLFIKQVDQLLVSASTATAKATAPHVDRTGVNNAAKEFNAAHAADYKALDEYTQHMKALEKTALEAAKTMKVFEQELLSGKSAAVGWENTYENMQDHFRRTMALRAEWDTKASQMRAKLAAERSEYLAQAKATPKTAATVADAAPQFDNAKLKEAIAQLEHARGELGKAVGGLDKAGLLTPFIASLEKIQTLMSDISYNAWTLKDSLTTGITVKNPVKDLNAKEIKETSAALKTLEVRDFGKLNTQLEELKGKFISVRGVVRDLAKDFHAIFEGVSMAGLSQLSQTVREVAAAGAAGGGGGHGGHGGGRGGDRYYNRDYSPLMSPDNDHVGTYYGEQDTELAARIKTHERLQQELRRNRELIRKGEQADMASFMAGLRTQGMKVWQGDVIPSSYVTSLSNARAAAEKIQAQIKREEAQTRWNQQAGTEGVQYKAFGDGFVKRNADTTLGVNTAAYSQKYDTDEVRIDNNRRNIGNAISALQAEALKGTRISVEGITAALERSKVAVDHLDNTSLNHLQTQLKKVNAEVVDGTVRLKSHATTVAEIEAGKKKLARNLSETVNDLGDENQRRVRKGTPEILVDPSYANNAIESIKDADTLSAARDLVARLKRQIREQAKDIRVDLEIGVKKESLEKATEKLRQGYEELQRANPSHKFPALDFSMDNFKGPLSEVEARFRGLQERVADAKAAFSKIRDAEEQLGSESIKIIERTNRVENSLLRQKQAEQVDLRRAFLTRLKAQEENQQRDWNKQARTEGVQYKKFDNGFVPKSFDTSLGTDPAAYNKKYENSELFGAQTRSNISSVVAGLKAEQLKGVHLTAQDVNKALEKQYIFIKKLDDASLAHLDKQLVHIGMSVKDSEVALRNANGQVTAFGGALQRMGTRLVEFYAIRTVLFAIGNEFRTTITTMMDLNQAIHDTIAISGAASTEYDRLSKAAISIAQSTKFSAKEVTEGMKILAQAGVDMKDLPDVTRVTALLATGSGATFEQASQILTTGMNVWKINGKESIAIANTFTAALNASKLQIGELGTAFNYLAAQSALSGRSLVETTALIAVLKNQGQQASTIGTSMSNFLGSLLNPNKKLKQYLKDYNISAEDVDPTKHTLVEIVRAFEDAASKTGISVKDLFATFDKRVARGTASLFKAGSDELLLMEERIKSTNAAATAWGESMKGIHGQINILRTEFVATMDNVISKVQELYGLKDVFRSFLVGLRDTTAQAGLASVAITGIGTALLFAFKKNAIGAALTVLAGLFAGLAAKIGETRREYALLFETLSKDVAATAGTFQRKTDALMTLQTAVKDAKTEKKTGKLIINQDVVDNAMREYPELSDPKLYKDKELLQKAMMAASAKTSGDYHAANREFIEKTNKDAEQIKKDILMLRKAFTKEYREELPDGISAEEIMKRSRELEKKRAAARTVPAPTNSLEPLLQNLGVVPSPKPTETIASTLLQKVGIGDGKDYTGVPYNAPSTSFQNKWGALAGKITTSEPSQATHEAVMLGSHGNRVNVDKVTGVRTYRYDPAAVDAVAAPGDANSESRIEPPDPSKGTADPNEAMLRYISEYQQRKSKLQVELAKIDKQLAAMELRDKEATNEDLEVAEHKMLAASAEAFDAEARRVREEVWNNVAKMAGGEYRPDPDNHGVMTLFYGADKDPAVVDKTIATGLKDLKDRLELVQEQRNQQEEKIQNAALNKRRHNTEQYETLVKKLDEESLVRQVAAEKKTAELAFKNRSFSWLEKLNAFEEFKEAETKRWADKEKAEIDDYNKKADKVDTPQPERDVVIGKIKAGITEKRDAAVNEEQSKLFTSPLSEDTARTEKHSAAMLRAANEELALKEKLAWTAQEIYGYQVQALDVEAQSIENNRESYEIALHELRLRLEVADELHDTEDQEGLNKQIEEYNDKLDVTKERLKQINQLRKEKTQDWTQDLVDGVKRAWQQITDLKRQTVDFGSSVTDTAFNGFSGSIEGSMNTVVNSITGSNRQQVDDAKAAIENLKREKAQLELDIGVSMANSSHTPTELKELGDKQIKLEGVTRELKKQTEALREQTNAWSAFAAGLKTMMKSILEELTKYISKLTAVYIAQKLIGLVSSAFSSGSQGGANAPPLASAGGADAIYTGNDFLFDTNLSGWGNGAGGAGAGAGQGALLLEPKAEGGMVPLSAGKAGVDSVPAMLMPGEVVIKKSSVDFYGPDKLLDLNAKRIQKFAEGGLVGGSSAAESRDSKRQSYSIQIVNVADANSIPPQPVDAEQVINIVSFSAAQRGAMHKVIKGVVAA